MAKLVKKITDANYEQEVILSVKPYIILLSAPFCDPGGRLEKILEEIAAGYADVVNAGTLDILRERELTEMFEISAAPTLIMMTGGVVDIRMSGILSNEDIIKVMELDKIREYRQRGFSYHPPRNFIPSGAEEEEDREEDGI